MLFDEDPFEVFKRNIYVHIFHEPDPQGLLDLGLPADRLMFGSDFPHPEGLGDPLAYSEVVEDLPQEDQELIMGGTIAKALKVGKYANRVTPTYPERFGLAFAERVLGVSSAMPSALALNIESCSIASSKS